MFGILLMWLPPVDINVGLRRTNSDRISPRVHQAYAQSTFEASGPIVDTYDHRLASPTVYLIENVAG